MAGDLDDVRTRRVAVQDALRATEATLAAPLVGRPLKWAAGVAPCITALRESWLDHVDVTEDEGGLFAQVRADQPRLSRRVQQLAAEHHELIDGLDEAGRALAAAGGDAEELTAVRESLTLLLGRLVRHRQRGADLIYEAYQVDIGSAE